MQPTHEEKPGDPDTVSLRVKIGKPYDDPKEPKSAAKKVLIRVVETNLRTRIASIYQAKMGADAASEPTILQMFRASRVLFEKVS